jgi:hypothetical protein
MKKEIKLHVKEMGKLRIYLPQGEKMNGEGLIRKLFTEKLLKLRRTSLL